MADSSDLSSDLSKYFEDWKDDERMGSLFGEFRPKNVNPEGWKNKMNIWNNAVNGWCRNTGRISFTLNDLRMTFERKGQYPRCLDQVFQHLVNEGILTNRASVNDSSASMLKQSWVNWGIDVLVKRPVVWGWNTLLKSTANSSNEQSAEEFVHMPLLKDMCVSIMKHLASEVNTETSTISMADCYNICKNQCSHKDSLLLILTQLQNQHKLVMFVESGTEYIKLCRKLEEKTKVQVTETDVGLLRLQKTLEKVESEVEKLRSDMDSFTSQAKAALKAGQKTKAQLFIKRRKLMEKAVEQKLNTAEKLEAMIFKLQDTSSQQEVVGALKAGLNAQKEIAAKGLGIDDVENTIEKIQEAFEDQAEIENMLAGPVVGLSHSLDDNLALEQELDDLLEQEKLLKDKKNIQESPEHPEAVGFSFPEVPAFDPSPPRLPSQSQIAKGLDI